MRPLFPNPLDDGPALLAYSARASIYTTTTRRGHLPLLHGITAMGYYLWAQRYMGRAGIVISLTVVGFMTICNFVTDFQHHSALVRVGRPPRLLRCTQPACLVLRRVWSEAAYRAGLGAESTTSLSSPRPSPPASTSIFPTASMIMSPILGSRSLRMCRVDQACGTHS